MCREWALGWKLGYQKRCKYSCQILYINSKDFTSKILCLILILMLLLHFHTKHSTKHQETNPFQFGHLFVCEIFEPWIKTWKAMAKVKKDASLCISANTSEAEFHESIQKIKHSKTLKRAVIVYIEWQLLDLPYKITKKETSKKMTKCNKFSKKKKIIKLKSAFKDCRLNNCSLRNSRRQGRRPQTMALLQLYKSTGQKMPKWCRQEKSHIMSKAYYLGFPSHLSNLKYQACLPLFSIPVIECNDSFDAKLNA